MKNATTNIDDEFLSCLKEQTEFTWSNGAINPAIYGFQFQKGTRWNPGLQDDEISGYERSIGTQFPNDLRKLMRFMNGTDIPTLNIYGNCGEPHRTSAGVYSYPRDLGIVKARLADVAADRDEIELNLQEYEQFVLEPGAGLLPFYGHRFVVCGRDENMSVVLSIHGADAIVYGPTLRRYLEIEFLT